MRLVLTPKFTPLSYADYTAPLRDYAEAYREAAEDYGELSDKTNAWKAIIEAEGEDSKAFQTYMKYHDDLRTAAEDFSEGMTLKNKRQLNRLRRSYSDSIVPLSTQIERREDLINEQRKLQGEHPELRFDRDMSQVSLDEMMADPKLSYRSLDLDQIKQDTGTIASALAQQYAGDTRVQELMGGDYLEFINQKGITPNELLTFIQEVTEAPENYNEDQFDFVQNFLQEARVLALQKSGIYNWKDSDHKYAVMQEALAAANIGLRGAVGDADKNQVINWRQQQKAEHDYQEDKALSDQLAKLEQEFLIGESLTSVLGTTKALDGQDYTGEAYAPDGKSMAELGLSFYPKYLALDGKDGKIKINYNTMIHPELAYHSSDVIGNAIYLNAEQLYNIATKGEEALPDLTGFGSIRTGYYTYEDALEENKKDAVTMIQDFYNDYVCPDKVFIPDDNQDPKNIKENKQKGVLVYNESPHEVTGVYIIQYFHKGGTKRSRIAIGFSTNASRGVKTPFTYNKKVMEAYSEITEPFMSAPDFGSMTEQDKDNATN